MTGPANVATDADWGWVLALAVALGAQFDTLARRIGGA